MSKLLLWATESQSCWATLEDSIKRFRVVYHPCPLHPSQELASCNFYTLTLVYHWLDKMAERCPPRGISSSPLLSVAHIQVGQPEKAKGIWSGWQQHLCVLQLPHRNICSDMPKERCTWRSFKCMGPMGYQEKTHRVTINWITFVPKNGCMWLLRILRCRWERVKKGREYRRNAVGGSEKSSQRLQALAPKS